jgi:hypothetical protein
VRKERHRAFILRGHRQRRKNRLIRQGFTLQRTAPT